MYLVIFIKILWSHVHVELLSRTILKGHEQHKLKLTLSKSICAWNAQSIVLAKTKSYISGKSIFERIWVWNKLYHSYKFCLLSPIQVTTFKLFKLGLLTVLLIIFTGEWPFNNVYLDIEHRLVEELSSYQSRCCSRGWTLMHFFVCGLCVYQQVIIKRTIYMKS